MEELLKESKSEGSKVCEVRKFQSRSFGWDVIERYEFCREVLRVP